MPAPQAGDDAQPADQGEDHCARPERSADHGGKAREDHCRRGFGHDPRPGPRCVPSEDQGQAGIKEWHRAGSSDRGNEDRRERAAVGRGAARAMAPQCSACAANQAAPAARNSARTQRAPRLRAAARARRAVESPVRAHVSRLAECQARLCWSNGRLPASCVSDLPNAAKRSGS